MEPLTVLREFASSGRLAQVSLSLDARTVKFGDQFEFGADAPTRWRAKGVVGANAASTAAATLPLGALAFFATSPTFFDKAPWGDYLKNARSAGFATVPVVDRKPLTNFLIGEYDGADHLLAASEAAAVAAVAAPPAADRKRKLDRGEGDEGGEGAAATKAAAASAAAPLAAAATAAAAAERAPSPSSPLDPLAITRSLELSLRDRNSQMLAAATVAGGGFSAVLEQADRAAAAEKVARARRDGGGSRGGGGGAPSSSHRAGGGGSTLGQIAALPSRRYERGGVGGVGGAGGAFTSAAAAAGGGGAPVEGLAEFDELGIQLYGARAAKVAEAAEEEAATAAARRRREAEEAARRAAAAAAGTGSGGKPRRAPASSSSSALAKVDSKKASAGGGGPSKAAAEPPGVSGGLPIIVVPAAATARLNMLNAPAFFSTGAFEHPDALRAAGKYKSPSATIVRDVAREGGGEAGSSQQQQQGEAGAAGAGGGAGGAAAGTKYFITDKTDAFRDLDWKRVVAVVVSGAAWQFKGWPFKGLKEGGHTVDLFSKVAGVFVGYADEEPPAAVKTWNVSRFGLHREARHRDRSVASAVWRAIDAMVASKKAREFG